MILAGFIALAVCVVGAITASITWAVTADPKVKINEPVTDKPEPSAGPMARYEPDTFTGSITILHPDSNE